MVRLKALVMALALGSAAGACGRSVAPYQTGSAEPDANAVLVRVVNNNFNDVDVYSVTSGGDATRLGSVTATTTGSFVLDPSYFPTGTLRLIARPIGGNGRALSDFLTVTPGMTIEFDIAPRLRDSMAIPR